MLCAGFVVRTVAKYIEKNNVKLSCMCLLEYTPPTPHGDASAVTSLWLLPCVTVMLGKNRGLGQGQAGTGCWSVHFCLCCLHFRRVVAPCKPVQDVDGMSPKQNCFSHWGCCESLPAPGFTGMGVCLTLSEQAQDPGCC